MDIVFASRHDKHPEEWVRALQQALPDHSVRLWMEGAASAGTAQAAVVWAPPQALFEQEPHLRYLFNLGAGVDALLQLPGLPAELSIVRLEDGGMADQMAEYALYHLLREARGFGQYADQQRQARWHRMSPMLREDWPVGILGSGRIGSRVAQVFAALDYPVAVWSRQGLPVAGAEVFSGPEGLPAFLARTRVLINVLPLTPATQGILCQDTFEALKPDAFLVNMARGAHLIESDLLAALESGRLRGAALDAFIHEPLPASHPFWAHPRIQVTPHVAGMSLLGQTVRQIAGKIQALARGEAISGVVDRAQQY
ncbi:MAG TPA: glyoxylate/hydroxypyruvate reductase A [Castellaniella sp.]|uniref:2-hydroxyacid dehydrogenase n=1 Tax=Castellaniella sp. TaxID=1955812 RepID=UPI002F15A160